MLRESIVLKGTGFEQERELQNVGRRSREGNKRTNFWEVVITLFNSSVRLCQHCANFFRSFVALHHPEFFLSFVCNVGIFGIQVKDACCETIFSFLLNFLSLVCKCRVTRPLVVEMACK